MLGCMSTARCFALLALLGFAFGYLTGCADAAPPCLAMAPEAPLLVAPDAAPHAWMAGRPPYVIDTQGATFPAALAAIERLNALAGGELLRPGTVRPVAVLENVNLGSSDIGGQTDCHAGEPCRVQTNFRYETNTWIWEHELVHALGYHGDDPDDPAHDLAGLMQPVNVSAVVSDAIVAHLRGLIATAVKCDGLLASDDTACL